MTLKSCQKPNKSPIWSHCVSANQVLCFLHTHTLYQSFANQCLFISNTRSPSFYLFSSSVVSSLTHSPTYHRALYNWKNSLHNLTPHFGCFLYNNDKNILFIDLKQSRYSSINVKIESFEQMHQKWGDIVLKVCPIIQWSLHTPFAPISSSLSLSLSLKPKTTSPSKQNSQKCYIVRPPPYFEASNT